jgi:endonuclease/exonuclease/phosphatase family metal-dependent hydrolase
MLILLCAVEWWGERHWLLSLFLYAPPQLLLLPLLGLTPAALLLRAGVVRWQLLLAVVIGFIYMSFRWVPAGQTGLETLTVITHNAGEGDLTQFRRFASTQKADVIVLQDVLSHSQMKQAFPSYHAKSEGKFLLLSRHPITSSKTLPQLKWHGWPVATRFEVLIRGEPLVFYNIHMPTPRGQLSPFLKRHFLTSLFLQQDSAVFASYQDWITARLELARSLAAVIAQETQPYIAAGDFNVPDHGSVYHLFAGQMTDAFAASGKGWGHTFPGAQRNRLSGYIGPWLRLDFIFAGKGWEPIYCRPERAQQSQHRAVVAKLNPAKER